MTFPSQLVRTRVGRDSGGCFLRGESAHVAEYGQTREISISVVPSASLPPSFPPSRALPCHICKYAPITLGKSKISGKYLEVIWKFDK